MSASLSTNPKTALSLGFVELFLREANVSTKKAVRYTLFEEILTVAAQFSQIGFSLSPFMLRNSKRIIIILTTRVSMETARVGLNY